MSARDITDPTLSRPRKPACTVPFGFPPVGRVIRAMVQSRSDWVTAVVIPTNSFSALGNSSPATTGGHGFRGVVALIGTVASPARCRLSTCSVCMAATMFLVPSVTGVPFEAASQQRPERTDHRIRAADRLLDPRFVGQLTGDSHQAWIDAAQLARIADVHSDVVAAGQQFADDQSTDLSGRAEDVTFMPVSLSRAGDSNGPRAKLPRHSRSIVII